MIRNERRAVANDSGVFADAKKVFANDSGVVSAGFAPNGKRPSTCRSKAASMTNGEWEILGGERWRSDSSLARFYLYKRSKIAFWMLQFLGAARRNGILPSHLRATDLPPKWLCTKNLPNAAGHAHLRRFHARFWGRRSTRNSRIPAGCNRKGLGLPVAQDALCDVPVERRSFTEDHATPRRKQRR